MKRRWAVVAAVAALLAVAVAGGVVSAAGRLAGEAEDKVIAKVAEKLGLEAAKVKDAHRQAVRAVEREKRTKALEELVKDGRLTREQADALNGWLDARPDAVEKLPGIPGLPGVPGLPAGPGLHPGAQGVAGQEVRATQKQVFEKMAAALGKDAAAIEKAFKEANAELGKERRTDEINRALEKLVKDGVITEQEAEDLRAWVEKAPGFLLDGSAMPFPSLRSFTGPRDGKPEGPPHMLPKPPTGPRDGKPEGPPHMLPKPPTGPRDGKPEGPPHMLPKPPGREGFRDAPRGGEPRGFRNFRGPGDGAPRSFEFFLDPNGRPRPPEFDLEGLDELRGPMMDDLREMLRRLGVPREGLPGPGIGPERQSPVGPPAMKGA